MAESSKPVEVAVIEGTKKNRSTEPATACEFYRSTLFRLAVERAKREHNDFVVVSAFYGLVEQREVLEPYETSLRDLPEPELRRWAGRVAEALADLYLQERLTLVAYASPLCVEALQPEVRRRRPGWSLRFGRGWGEGRGGHGGRPSDEELVEAGLGPVFRQERADA
jgi:hypothetical protein